MGEKPARKVNFPKLDNSRNRFYSNDQVDALLSEFVEKNMDVHDMVLLSILSDLRFCEIVRLRLEHVDLEKVPSMWMVRMGKRVKLILIIPNLWRCSVAGNKLPDSQPIIMKSAESVRGLIFDGPVHGGILKDVLDIFMKMVGKLGLNERYEDAQQRLTFHSCRHTFGSRWQCKVFRS